jgi:hypothetical protein
MVYPLAMSPVVIRVEYDPDDEDLPSHIRQSSYVSSLQIGSNLRALADYLERIDGRSATEQQLDPESSWIIK